MSSATVSLDRPPPEVKDVVRIASRVDNRRNVVYLTADWLVIASATVLHAVMGGIPAYLLAVVVIGTRMRALANLLHESAHYKLFADRRLNAAVGQVLCAWPIFIGYRRYTAEHRLHHQNLWRTENDPDLPLYRWTGTEYSSAGRTSFRSFLTRHVLLALVPIMPWRQLVSSAGWPRMLRMGGVAVFVLAAVAFINPALAAGVVLYWLVPWLTVYQIVSYWAELGEHGGLRQAGPAWGSRNWRGNILSRLSIGSHSDDLYHLLHHWFPSVPHYRLDEVDRECLLRWPQYARQARCTGFFLSSGGRVSVMRDIWAGGAASPRQALGKASHTEAFPVRQTAES